MNPVHSARHRETAGGGEIDLMRQAEAERLKAGYNWRQRLGEVAGITAFFALTPVLLIDLFAIAYFEDVAWWGLVAAAGVFGGLIGADFVSAVVHWMADNWGRDEWPIVGTHFIRPFRHHHVDPQEMTHHGFVELNGNNCIVSLPAWPIAWSIMDGVSPAWGLFWGTFWLSLAYWVLGTNQFHAWAHTDRVPRVIAALQWSRLILSPRHHDVHHRQPHDRNYAITNGWTNPVLRALRFFEIIEWTVTKISGVRPEHAKIADRMAEASPKPVRAGVL